MESPPEPLGRRAPFAANGEVGPRARETQRRILDAALRVFDDVGYEAATLEAIGKRADRSRVSVYQYFDDKEHLFQELTARLGGQLWSSLEALEPITADATGWSVLRAWLARQADLHRDHRAVFREFATATSDDAEFVSDAMRARERQIALFATKITDPAGAADDLSAAIGLLLAGSSRTLELASVIRTELPDVYGRDRVTDALTNVFHRALFSLMPEVNVRPAPPEASPRLPVPPALTEVLDRAAAIDAESASPDRAALAALLSVGHDVIARRGHRGARVGDITEAAAVSRGAFYKYFVNRDDYIRIIAARALRTTTNAFGQVPDLANSTSNESQQDLRAWLGAIESVHQERRTLLHARTGVRHADGTLETQTPGAYDWGRRRMARLLRSRPFGGDIDGEALVLLGLLEGYGAQARESRDRDAMLGIIEAGLLGTKRTPGGVDGHVGDEFFQPLPESELAAWEAE